MNRTFLVGRITADPELRTTPNGIATTRITVAVNRMPNANGERVADFINVVVWRRQAENVAKYCNKGSLVGVEGRLQSRSYDAQDGTRRYVTEVVADNVEFLGSKNSSNNSSNGSHNEEPTPYDFGDEKEPKGTDVDSNPFADFGSSIEISDDELPF